MEGRGSLWVRKTLDMGLARSRADYSTIIPLFSPLPVLALSACGKACPIDSSDLVTSCGFPLSAIILSETGGKKIIKKIYIST
jgi:hypothetical protein